MSENKQIISSNLAKANAHLITADEYTEIPELDDAFFNRADAFDGEKLIRRGRPVQVVTKSAVKLRLDPDIVLAFKAEGRGWQTRMNNALRKAVQQGWNKV